MGCGGAGVPELLLYEIRDFHAKCSIKGNVDVQQTVFKFGLPKGTFVVIFFKPEKNLGKKICCAALFSSPFNGRKTNLPTHYVVCKKTTWVM